MRRRVAVIGAGAPARWPRSSRPPRAPRPALERTRDGGRKILISGGGRCNMLPARVDERRFVTDSSPHTLRNILRAWPLAEQIAFFERELSPAGGGGRVGEAVPGLEPRARRARWIIGAGDSPWVEIPAGDHCHRARAHWERLAVDRGSGEPLGADAVVVATGGLSVCPCPSFSSTRRRPTSSLGISLTWLR